MNCTAIRDELSAHLDGALDAAACRTVEEHLAGCADCRRLADDLGRVKSSVAALPRAPAPAALAAGVEKEMARPARILAFPRRGLGSLAAAAMVMLVFTYFWQRPAERQAALSPVPDVNTELAAPTAPAAAPEPAAAPATEVATPVSDGAPADRSTGVSTRRLRDAGAGTTERRRDADLPAAPAAREGVTVNEEAASAAPALIAAPAATRPAPVMAPPPAPSAPVSLTTEPAAPAGFAQPAAGSADESSRGAAAPARLSVPSVGALFTAPIFMLKQGEGGAASAAAKLIDVQATLQANRARDVQRTGTGYTALIPREQLGAVTVALQPMTVRAREVAGDTAMVRVEVAPPGNQ